MNDFERLDGCAFITGGTGGLGSAIALLFAERGADVAFTFRSNETASQDLVAQLTALGVRAEGIQCDLSDPDSVARVVSHVEQGFGGIHTLVHAAGPHIPQQHLSKIEPEQYKQALIDEVAAFFNVAHAVLPALRATRGSVVAVTTAATKRYPVRDALSSGTKGAVDQLVMAIAAEEGRFGIRANCVGPGMLTDGMAARLIASGDLDEAALEVTRRNIPLRTFGTATDIAEAVCFLASSRAGFITGQHLSVDGGYTV